MANARLTSLSLTKFKSYADKTTVQLSPLTILLGRNNSGKSSLIQALLLLKQTVNLPRTDVPLHLEGIVDALSLRELTHGWPESGPLVQGPTISLRWESTADIGAALAQAKKPEITALIENTGIHWLANERDTKDLITELTLTFAEDQGRTVLSEILLTNTHHGARRSLQTFAFTRKDGAYNCRWNGQLARQLTVELDHFIPFISIDRRNIGPRDRQRSWHNAFLLLFAQPLDDLKKLLLNFGYLGSIRTLPPTLYRPATVPPDDIGVSGEYAAQMLHSRRSDKVHYLPPISVDKKGVHTPLQVRGRPLVEAVNDVMQHLGVDAELRIEDVKDVGFRLLFGQASLQHVGRGLSYLLPVIQLGLIADPVRFSAGTRDTDIQTYLSQCTAVAHCAFEEPEAHLHPKVQTRLAHWLVSLAMSGRQVIVETHSDHLVRRLRGLAARAAQGSELEKWLLENVQILEVEQTGQTSTVRSTRLTASGTLEHHWPKDFMDEASEEEREIYHAGIGKRPKSNVTQLDILHDKGKEPNE